MLMQSTVPENDNEKVNGPNTIGFDDWFLSIPCSISIREKTIPLTLYLQDRMNDERSRRVTPGLLFTMSPCTAETCVNNITSYTN